MAAILISIVERLIYLATEMWKKLTRNADPVEQVRKMLKKIGVPPIYTFINHFPKEGAG